MEAIQISEAVDLWEAWIEIAATGTGYTLYVVGDVHTGSSKTVPVLVKKKMQGLASSHLVLELLPGIKAKTGRLAEVHYAEPITIMNRYKEVSICAGEDIIARLRTIEIVY